MNWLVKLTTKNIGIKVFCLVLSSILWLYIFMTQNSIAKFPTKIPVKPLNVAENLVPVLNNTGIEINISAEAGTWSRLSSSSFSAYVDLSGYTAGTYEVPVSVTSSVFGVTVVNKNPDKIMVTLEPVVEKEVAVDQKVEGELSTGYVISSVNFSPAKVKIKGQKNLVNNINKVSALIKLSGQKTSYKEKFPVYAYDSSNNILESIQIEPKEVEGEVTIAKGSNVKSVGVVPTLTGNPRENYIVKKVIINPSIVDVSGNGANFENLRFINTQDINIEDISQKTEYKIKLKLPEGIAPLNNDQTFNVTVEVEALSIAQSISINIFRLSNIDNAEILTVSPNLVLLTILKPLSASIDNDTAYIVIDMTRSEKTGDKTYKYKVLQSDIVLPKNVSIDKFDPQEITIKLK